MSSQRPLVSVSLETYNASANEIERFDQVIEELRAQDYPQDRIEVVVTIVDTETELIRLVTERHPWVRIVPLTEPTYYGMKRAGMDAASGDIVVLTDADCELPTDFVSRIAANVEQGADLVVGKVRFTPGVRFAKTFDVFSFGHIKAGPDGQAQAFSVNNVSFRASLLDRHGFDPRIQRSGGAYLLGRQLAAAGYNLVYDPSIEVIHDFHDVKFQVMMRMRTGFEMMNLTQIDDHRVLPETRFRGLGWLGAPIGAARRFLIDVRSFFTERDHLGIGIHEVPYFVLASFAMRCLETYTGIVTWFRPTYYPEKYGW